MAAGKDDGRKRIAENRKARFEYRIEDTWEAGIALTAATLLWTAGAWIQARGAARWPTYRFVRAGFAVLLLGLAGALERAAGLRQEDVVQRRLVQLELFDLDPLGVERADDVGEHRGAPLGAHGGAVCVGQLLDRIKGICIGRLR